MAEITIRWNRNTPDGESRWDGMADAVADAVADLLESFEQAETEGLPGQETDYFIAETHRLANDVSLAYRARRAERNDTDGGVNASGPAAPHSHIYTRGGTDRPPLLKRTVMSVRIQF